jgi:hypothetical protein
MRVVAGLAAVAALLAVFVFVADRAPPGGAGARPEHGRLVGVFNCSVVRRLAITRRGEAPFSLVHQPPGRDPAWRVAPGDRPADATAVEDLLTTIDLAETERTADLTPQAAGLAPPTVAIVLEAAGAPLSLSLGRADAGTGGVFVSVGGQSAIRVASRRLLDLADRDAGAFRDRRLVPLSPEVIVSVAWTSDSVGDGLRLVSGRWQNGAQQWVVGDRVAESLRRLVDLRFEPSAWSLSEPRPEHQWLKVAANDGQVVKLAFFRKRAGDETAVVRDGRGDRDGGSAAAAAVAGIFSALKAASAPDTRLVSSPPESVTRIEILDGARRLLLDRAADGAWHFAFPKAPYRVDPRAVQDWLTAAGQTHITRAPLKPSARRLVIDAGYREVAQVLPAGEGYALIDPDPIRFRDRAVLDFDHFDARVLRRASGGTIVEIASDDGDTWHAVTPGQAAVDPHSVARVVGALANLRAEGFIPAPPSRTPEVSLEVVVATPGEKSSARHAIELYPAPRQRCIGRLDRAAVFTLPRAACDELRLPLVAPGG